MESNAENKTDRALDAYANLVRASEEVGGLLDKQLKSYGLTTGQCRALAALLHRGPMSQAALGREIFCGTSTTRAVVQNLVRRKLVAKRAHDRNRQGRVVQITEEGKKLAMKILPLQAKLIRARMTALDVREQRLLVRTCGKLADGNPVRFIRELTLVE
jgi:DNA-binding MarR family transcriptional regulator